MTDFISTRGGDGADGATAVTGEFAPDGGLYVPRSLPALDYNDLLDLDYAARTEKVLRAFWDVDIKSAVKAAFESFDGDPAPLVKIDDNAFILELWHGKTHTSKDIAYAVLPELMAATKAKSGDKSRTLIILATNGDMGKAAAEAYANSDARLCIFYPTDGIRKLFKKELCAVDIENVCVVGVNGSFDDVQAAVKTIFSNCATYAENNIKLSSANSINIGVVTAQIAYYYSAYCDLVNSDEIKAGEKIDFIVPTGNFGGTLAGYYAAKMGLPINKLVCVSSENTALIDFIDSGVYDINRTVGRSKVPMLGNLERLIFEISGRNAMLTAERMNELDGSGRFSVTESEIDEVRKLFAGECVDGEVTRYTVSEMFDEYGYVADTRTAAAFAVATHREFVRPTAIVSLTNPYKTAADVMQSLGEKYSIDDEQLLRRMEEETAMEAPQSIIDVFSAKQVHDKTVELADVPTFVFERYCHKE